MQLPRPCHHDELTSPRLRMPRLCRRLRLSVQSLNVLATSQEQLLQLLPLRSRLCRSSSRRGRSNRHMPTKQQQHCLIVIPVYGRSLPTKSPRPPRSINIHLKPHTRHPISGPLCHVLLKDRPSILSQHHRSSSSRTISPSPLRIRLEEEDPHLPHKNLERTRSEKFLLTGFEPDCFPILLECEESSRAGEASALEVEISHDAGVDGHGEEMMAIGSGLESDFGSLCFFFFFCAVGTVQ